MRESDHCREMVGATSFLHPDISIFESVFCDYIALVQNRSSNIEFENCIHIILFFDSEQMHIVCQIKSRSESFCEYEDGMLRALICYSRSAFRGASDRQGFNVGIFCRSSVHRSGLLVAFVRAKCVRPRQNTHLVEEY